MERERCGDGRGQGGSGKGSVIGSGCYQPRRSHLARLRSRRLPAGPDDGLAALYSHQPPHTAAWALVQHPPHPCWQLTILSCSIFPWRAQALASLRQWPRAGGHGVDPSPNSNPNLRAGGHGVEEHEGVLLLGRTPLPVGSRGEAHPAAADGRVGGGGE